MTTHAPFWIGMALFLALSSLPAEEPKIQTKELKGAMAAQFIKERTRTKVSEIAKGKCISINIQNSFDQHRIIESVQLFLVRPAGKKDVDVAVFEWAQGARSDGDVNVLFNITDQEVKSGNLVFRERKFDDARLNSSIEVRTTIRLESILEAAKEAKKP